MFHLFLSSFTAKSNDVMLRNPYLYFLNQSSSIVSMYPSPDKRDCKHDFPKDC